MEKSYSDETEFMLTYRTGDSVYTGDIPPYEKERRPVTPQDAAIYGVKRLLDQCGPEHFDVDVVDEQGVTHQLEVYRWHKGWVCEERVAIAPDAGSAGESRGGVR